MCMMTKYIYHLIEYINKYMETPKFLSYFEDGLHTPFESPLLVGGIAIPYSLVLTAALKFPTETYNNLLIILGLLTIYKFILYAITYSMHYKTQTNGTLSNAQENIGTTIATTVLTLSLIGLGFILLVVPGIWLSVRLALAIPIATVHGYPPQKSIMQSYKLTGNATKQIGGLFAETILLAFFIVVAATAAIFVGFKFELLAWVTLLILSIIASLIELGSQAALIEVLLEQEQM